MSKVSMAIFIKERLNQEGFSVDDEDVENLVSIVQEYLDLESGADEWKYSV